MLLTFVVLSPPAFGRKLFRSNGDDIPGDGIVNCSAPGMPVAGLNPCNPSGGQINNITYTPGTYTSVPVSFTSTLPVTLGIGATGGVTDSLVGPLGLNPYYAPTSNTDSHIPMSGHIFQFVISNTSSETLTGFTFSLATGSGAISNDGLTFGLACTAACDNASRTTANTGIAFLFPPIASSGTNVLGTTYGNALHFTGLNVPPNGSATFLILITDNSSTVVNQPANTTINVTIAPDVSVKAGLFAAGVWFIDQNNDRGFELPGDREFQWGPSNVTPVMGDWNGDGRTKVGLYLNGIWYLDYNGDGVFEQGTDKVYNFGSSAATPVVGDWNGDGRSKIGIYQAGMFILDTNGDGVYEPGTDAAFGWGPVSGAKPVIGDWDGTGISKVGVFAAGFWTLDVNGNGVFDAGIDAFFGYGAPSSLPVVGDWNGDGRTKVGAWATGVYPGNPNLGQFVLDVNGDFLYEPGGDATFAWGSTGSVPITGDWNGDGRSKIGVFYNGYWTLDYNGDFAWEPNAFPLEQTFQFGGCGGQAFPCGQVPVPARW
jgi:hypothetical protein